jgi:hypothetical protein
MTAMRDMSRAIRHELQEHGPTLKEIPDGVLDDYIQILGALYFDLQDEKKRRQRLEERIGNESGPAR